jgi:endonuclease YncB( thermonuclease family)
MLTFRTLFVLILGAVTLAAPLSAAPHLQGEARVVDGDTLDLGGLRIRLFGIDAPEQAQSCGADGWACGRWATQELAALVAGKTIRCAPRGQDRYGRVVAVCWAGAADVAAALVSMGAAEAYRKYSSAYIGAEKAAKSARLGIWADRHIAPAEFRAAKSLRGPDRCVVKGNVSAKGEKIYHVPGQRDYDAVRISAAKGEAYFCTEAEAKAAGFRPSRR